MLIRDVLEKELNRAKTWPRVCVDWENHGVTYEIDAFAESMAEVMYLQEALEQWERLEKAHKEDASWDGVANGWVYPLIEQWQKEGK